MNEELRWAFWGVLCVSLALWFVTWLPRKGPPDGASELGTAMWGTSGPRARYWQHDQDDDVPWIKARP